MNKNLIYLQTLIFTSRGIGLVVRRMLLVDVLTIISSVASRDKKKHPLRLII